MYQNSNIVTMRKVPVKICSWITILILSTALFVIFSLTFKYKKYLKYDAVVNNNYVELYIDENFFIKSSSDKVLINNKEYHYDVVALEEYSYNMGEVEYWKIMLDIDLPKNLKVENNRLRLEFLDKETTFYNNVLEKIKKGMG